MTTASLLPDLLTPEQAGEYIGGVKSQTLALWRCSGRYGIPFIRVGSKIRYRRADLDRFLAARTVVRCC